MVVFIWISTQHHLLNLTKLLNTFWVLRKWEIESTLNIVWACTQKVFHWRSAKIPTQTFTSCGSIMHRKFCLRSGRFPSTTRFPLVVKHPQWIPTNQPTNRRPVARSSPDGTSWTKWAVNNSLCKVKSFSTWNSSPKGRKCCYVLGEG